MAVTKQPTGQDLVCLVCGTDKDIDIDHVQNRGMGGSKERDVPENKVPLCRECHTAKTNGVLETELFPLTDGRTNYHWRRKNAAAQWISVPVKVSKRYGCLVLSAAAEGEDSATVPALSAAAPSVRQEESDEQTGRDIGRSPGDGGPDSLRSVPDNRLTHDQRAAIAAGIKEMEQGRQFLAGDTAIEWEEELGEDFWNEWANEFGYTYPSLRNAMRVCAAIPENIRRPLRFSHHVVVSDLNREDIEMWLDKCVEEGWSVAEFRRQVKGGRPRVKRYSVEELRECVHSWLRDPSSPAMPHVTEFLEWLEGEQA